MIFASRDLLLLKFCLSLINYLYQLNFRLMSKILPFVENILGTLANRLNHAMNITGKIIDNILCLTPHFSAVAGYVAPRLPDRTGGRTREQLQLREAPPLSALSRLPLHFS